MQLCAGRAPSLQHARAVGRRGHLQRPLQTGVKSGGGRSQLFLHVLPKQSRRMRGGGRNAHKERSLFPQDKEGPRKRILTHPHLPTVTKVKDLVSESMRWVTGVWWGKQRMLETGVPSSPFSPALEENRLGPGERAPGAGAGVSNHWSASPKTSFCLRFMFSKSKAEPTMRL